MTKYLIKILLLLATPVIFSQNYKGNLADINQNGFHKILLSPEIRSASLSNTHFFRILDSKKNEVPYVVLNNNSALKSSYLSFAYQTTNNAKDSITTIIIENKKQLELDHLAFKIANTKVRKTFTISGSNDNKEWYGLATNQLFYGLNEAEKTTVEQTFSFPLNNYAFLKFEFSNKKSLPLQILDIGLYKSYYSTVSQVEITDFKSRYINDKENKSTQIIVTFNIPQHIESMSFNIENNVFLRDAKILATKTRIIKKRAESYQSNVFNFELHSGTHNTFDLPYLFEKEFIIEIQNNDNQPLNIKHLRFFQKPLYVVCDLKSNNTYEVIIDTTLHKPIYDLVNFKTSFNSNLPQANITNFSKISTQNESSLNKKSFWQTNVFMWLCIVLAIVVIGYFAMSLLKDLKNNASN